MIQLPWDHLLTWPYSQSCWSFDFWPGDLTNGVGLPCCPWNDCYSDAQRQVLCKGQHHHHYQRQVLWQGQHHQHHQRQVLITIVIIVVAITKVRAESMLTYVLDETKLQLLEVIFSLFINKNALKIQPKTITAALRMFLLLAFKGKKMWWRSKAFEDKIRNKR